MKRAGKRRKALKSKAKEIKNRHVGAVSASIQAFGTRRVTEALSAIAGYLDEQAHLAAASRRVILKLALDEESGGRHRRSKDRKLLNSNARRRADH